MKTPAHKWAGTSARTKAGTCALLLLVASVGIAREPNRKAMMLSDTAQQQLHKAPAARPLPVEPAARAPGFAPRYGMEEDRKVRAVIHRLRGSGGEAPARVLSEPRWSASPKSTVQSRTLMDLETKREAGKPKLATATRPMPLPEEPK